jgi:hypothetical protein
MSVPKHWLLGGWYPSRWKITRAFPTMHASTYFFRKPTTFTITNSSDALYIVFLVYTIKPIDNVVRFQHPCVGPVRFTHAPIISLTCAFYPRTYCQFNLCVLRTYLLLVQPVRFWRLHLLLDQPVRQSCAFYACHYSQFNLCIFTVLNYSQFNLCVKLLIK